MKPIIRWTIGGQLSNESFVILQLSVKNVKRLWGDQFEYMICYNGLKDHKGLPKVDRLIDQSEFRDSLPFPPRGPAWKLYPPRLNISVHEIIIDNDLLLYEKPALLEKFLETDDMIVITEAFRRSYSGQLESKIPADFNINTGLMCFPPNFDFAQYLVVKEWEHHFDEQTAVAFALSKIPNVHIIPLSDVFVCFEEYRRAKCGLHFVGVNGGNRTYWDSYLRNRLL
tara:strand:+ start:4628 stop:5305 length:678 start_codon:yes stop_codon:yes gene_type:complete